MAMPQIVLNSSGVLPVVGEFEAAGMAKHVRMHREFDSGFPTSSGYYSPH